MKCTQWIALAFCAMIATPAAALDPVSLIVLRMLRDHLITQQLEAAVRPGGGPSDRSAPAPVRQYPGDIKTLVDEGFPQLDRAQRSAVHARLMEVMADPRHAAERDSILAQFVEAASASREAHEALARLSYSEKKTIAVRAAESYRGKTREEREEMIDLLRSPAVPIPSDLRALMLAEFSAQSAIALSR